MAKIGINDFIDTLLLGPEVFRTLRDVEVIFDFYHRPTFIAGREGPVFKVEIRGQVYALKCYSSRAHKLHPLHQFIQQLQSPLIIAPQLLTEELWVGDHYADVAIYEWVEGYSLEWEIKRALHKGDTAHLTHLAEEFTLLASNLLSTQWRHGDIKPENIIVDNTGAMKFIDCDSIYHPSLQWQGKVGTPPYVHPQRKEAFDSYIDDYAIALIITSLHALARRPELFTGELMVAQPALNHRSLIEQLFEDDASLIELLNALYSISYKTPSLNHILQCILHK